jgi:hypothetical protein
MCGIAGIIHRNNHGRIGVEMTAMLQSMKHRGPDSSGFAVYGDACPGEIVVRCNLADQRDAHAASDDSQLEARRRDVAARIAEVGGEILSADEPTPYACRFRVRYGVDLRRFSEAIESVAGAEILSIGSSLELVKDLGDAQTVSRNYSLDGFTGTHAIGHVRMATESDVDICSAHPFWAYPFSDVAVVHNGQITNYWSMRRRFERRGLRFLSDCDSELIAVYLADRIERGEDLKQAMRDSVGELDGVFTYLVATADSLGMAKDVMAAKPMVLYESDDCVALASEEVAIRSVIPHEIDTTDPYDGEVRVWRN